jgi:short-subunit dehydrogenase
MSLIAVFGAGPGLGRAVARRYAREGYDVALVGRRPQPLAEFAAELTALGVGAHAVTGDLSDPAGVEELAGRVRDAAGDPDVVYYAPVSSQVAFVPAAQQTAETAQRITTLLYTSFVAVVQEFLPHMLAQGTGAVLTAQGASALAGLPGMSGPGPAAAAQRNYLQSLAAEVGGRGVFVGRLYIASVIGGSAIDRQMQAARDTGAQVPPAVITPADELAERLWTMHAAFGPNEAVVPESNPFTS